MFPFVFLLIFSRLAPLADASRDQARPLWGQREPQILYLITLPVDIRLSFNSLILSLH